MSKFVENPSYQSYQFENFGSYYAHCEEKGGSTVPVIVDFTDKDPILKVGLSGWCPDRCSRKCGLIHITEVRAELLNGPSDPLQATIVIRPDNPGEKLTQAPIIWLTTATLIDNT